MGVRRVARGACAALGAATLLVAPTAGATDLPPPPLTDGSDAGNPDAAGFGSGFGVPLGRAFDNPRGPLAAAAWARAQVGGERRWSARCLNFTAQAYGWSYA